ncbi:MAG: hypothetical protein ABIR15_23310 [Chitinophagaceae bacterium]
MEPYKQDGKELKNVVKENFPVYESREALEEARLKEAINRTPAEKFYFLMTLMKMNRQMRNATIHYK